MEEEKRGRQGWELKEGRWDRAREEVGLERNGTQRFSVLDIALKKRKREKKRF